MGGHDESLDRHIGERLATVEVILRGHTAETNRRLDEVTDSLRETNLGLSETNKSLQAVCLTLAEARGAGKMAKLISHGVSLVAGFIGGGAGNALLHK